jgi:hypothetical protein
MPIKIKRIMVEAWSLVREEELKSAVIASAIRYSQIRAEWAQSSPKRRRLFDASRSRARNAFLGACINLSRVRGRSGNYRRTALSARGDSEISPTPPIFSEMNQSRPC